MRRRDTCTVVVAWGLLALAPGAARAGDANGWIESMGTLPDGSFSAAFGVNNDGTVVVGGGNSAAGNRAIRWTRATGPIEIPGSTNPAYCVSYGGNHVATNPLLFLEGAAPINIGTEPIAMSADGRRIVGSTPAGNLYQVGTGWTTLPGLGAGADISPDGQWVIGSSGGSMTRWSQSTGTQVLGAGRAGNISANGQIVCGDHNRQLVRWTSETGVETLGSFPNTAALAATGMSDDGNVIIGLASVIPPGGSARPNPFIWPPQTGMISLRSFLTSQGISVSGFTLVDVWEVSNDGRTIVGMAFDPDSRITGFIAHVPTLPAPGAASFSLFATLTLARRSRRP